MVYVQFCKTRIKTNKQTKKIKPKHGRVCMNTCMSNKFMRYKRSRVNVYWKNVSWSAHVFNSRCLIDAPWLVHALEYVRKYLWGYEHEIWLFICYLSASNKATFKRSTTEASILIFYFLIRSLKQNDSPITRAPLWVHFSEYPEYLACDYKKNCTDLNLGEGLCIFTSVHLPDSGLFNLLNGFDFYFRWCDSENQQ